MDVQLSIKLTPLRREDEQPSACMRMKRRERDPRPLHFDEHLVVLGYRHGYLHQLVLLRSTRLLHLIESIFSFTLDIHSAVKEEGAHVDEKLRVNPTWMARIVLGMLLLDDMMRQLGKLVRMMG